MVDQVIKLKRNTSNSNAPGTSDIAVGELAIGAVAGKLYIRKSDDSILEFTDASASSSAADDITTGDAAVTIATTSGNITLDAQANDSDIIFKGTDGGSDTTFLTIDGSAAGAATFNDKIVATELDISGDVDIDGTLEADAITVNSTALSSVIAGTTVTLASTATALANARTIGGVSFDGSANITPTTFAAATFSGDVNVDSGVLFVDVSENKIGINQASPDVSLDLGANTDSIHVPVGTTAQRPGSPAAGYFRYNSTSGKFEGYTDAWGSIGGGSGTNMDTNIFAGDGSDTTFTLSTAPDTENNLMVFVDGVFQAQNVYSVSGTTLTFATAPANGRVITVYHSTTTVGGSNNTINTMTGDNSDTTLTLSVAPVHENNVQVYFDGVYQSKSNYAIDGTTLTFSTAPATGVLVEAITNTNTSSTTANQLLDADGDTKIQVEESSDEDTIRFDIAGTEQIVLADGVLKPTTDNDIDLGTSSLEFKDAFFDGTVTSDAFAGPLTGDVTGNADTATVATTVTITDNENTNENNAIIFTAGGDLDGGNLGLESDGDLTYNPSTGLVTATGFSGNLTGTLQTAAQANITSVGTLTALTVDDITINGSTISDAGDLTLDVAGEINLDADGGKVRFKDAGTEIGRIVLDNNQDLEIVSSVNDKDLKLRGQDNGSTITALTLDMSEAGAATFNDKVIADSFETTAGGTFTTASGNDLNIVYPDTRSLFIKEDSTTHVTVDNTGNVGIGTTSPVLKLSMAPAGDGTKLGYYDDGTHYSFVEWYNNSDADTNFYKYDGSGGDYSFTINNSEKIRFLSTGGMTFNGDSATANALDDYEEGTHEPTPSISGATGAIAFKSAYNKLSYTKIGNQVHINGYLQVESNTGNGGRLNLTLPFTSAAGSEGEGSALFHVQIAAGTGSQDSGYFSPLGGNSSSLQVQKYTGVGSSNDSIVTMAANSYLYIAGTYTAA